MNPPPSIPSPNLNSPPGRGARRAGWFSPWRGTPPATPPAPSPTNFSFLILNFSFALLLLLTGCTQNPVTGKRELNLFTQEEEIALDIEYAPLQIASDYGIHPDPALNTYVASVGSRLIPLTHRPAMPYRFLVVNAVNANVYAMPGGTVCVTRGLLAELDNEAQLAALLAHELAHVNARDTARLLSRPTGHTPLPSSPSSPTPPQTPSLWDGLPKIADSRHLPHYTREHELLADAAGMQYMADAGYDPRQLPVLLEILDRLSSPSPHFTAQLHATHPPSPERLQRARLRAGEIAGTNATLRLDEAGFRLATLPLRAQKNAFPAFNDALLALRSRNPQRALTLADQGLRQSPRDYVGLLIMADALNALGRTDEAIYYARQAADTHPGAPAPLLALAQADITLQNYRAALEKLDQYSRILPGNTLIDFYTGLCHEALGDISSAKTAFLRFTRGKAGPPRQEDYARRRLAAWLHY